MKLTDIRRFKDFSPLERASWALEFGSELAKRRRQVLAPGRLPAALRAPSMGVARDALNRLHRIAGAAPQVVSGLKALGSLKLGRVEAEDLVLTRPARKQQANAALARRPSEPVQHLALRQLAVGMLDGEPIPRLCCAYAYWQATGAKHAVVPILLKGLASKNNEEFMVAAHCVGQLEPRHLSPYMGGPEDDRAASPQHKRRKSMTVIIHGTFAKNQGWYKPGGAFHAYIKKNVYSDVYSGDDYFFWSGRYSRDPVKLRGIWRAAAKKLVTWCEEHPAGVLRLIAHSHGANVVNLATQNLPACTLIHLSPPVHDDVLPNMANVASSRFFNIHSTIDLVVKIDGGRQDYKGTPVAQFERRRKCARFGHSKSHEGARWTAKKVPKLVTSVCAPDE